MASRPSRLSGIGVSVAVMLADSWGMSGTTQSHNPGNNVETDMSIPVQKFTTNPVRHELEPLTKRFPLLGQPISASWVAGDVGDPEIPGPSAYWIDSVVEVSPDVVDTLKSTYQPEQTSAQPDVWNSLLPMLPVGGYLAGSALDQAFSSRRIWTKVFLAEQENVVVIAAVGE